MKERPHERQFDYSFQPSVVGELIRAEEAVKAARESLNRSFARLFEERPRVVALQEQVDLRAGVVFKDALSFAHEKLVPAGGGRAHRHPRSRSGSIGSDSSGARFTLNASEDFVIEDNGQSLPCSVAYRRTMQGKRTISESFSITQPGDREFILSLSYSRNGRDTTRSLRVRDGNGLQELVQGHTGQKWHGRQEVHPGREAYDIPDVLVVFGWYLGKLYDPIFSGELVEREEVVD